ncbi:hypothetical protein MTX26_08255 [Bradyrhizobium sp. ISRA443]|uniref:hypothetical protein n=1 Tax=unclassified Bradyrhizobium TaxID=2631580 RepID=UPI00247AB4B0|nr:MULTISPECIES: hypothetical protein [unclassified Bradyrhizobium]WGR95719.1 hypothetical protein MTX20_18530 [Bradyrhizobium sp. ISRA435]WGS00807.1 hypothetical protein MTX23_08250 [Bradyrhizobium sp. ISRA436]WGS07694.1 hypothetical protein MTX18_08255 [Bradyrhizobium sp. ISRA437]WGS14582.1 hypothetical protein MTX26_08255 [Bradyrhizobium sp. ISRA443]
MQVTVVALVSSAACAGTSEGYGMGGWIGKFQPETDRANATRELFRIKGHCQSNCTLFLGLRNVCVERSATLLFHAGHDRQRNINATSTQRMLNAYKPALRQYVLAHHYMDTLEFHAIPGAMIIDRFGYKECPRS